MTKDGAQVINACERCSVRADEKESILLVEEGDWRTPYKEYLDTRVVPREVVEARKFKKYAEKILHTKW